jgi:conjugal transfer pilus assembly protein TraB
MEKLKIWYQNQDPEKRQKYIKFGIIAAVTILVLGWYFLSGEDEKRKEEQLQIQEGMQQEEALDNFDLLADDVSETFQNQFEQQNSSIDTAVSTAERTDKKTDELAKQMAIMMDMLQQQKDGIAKGPANSEAYFELPPAQQQGYQPPPSFRPDNVEIQQPPKIIGTIGRVTGTRATPEKKSPKEEKYFLPISFARAQSLHGLRIVTSAGAMADPEQLLIRIQAPSVLPNSIRADLEGCFVMTSVTGHLAKRRVDPKLAYLSCLSKNGEAVIQEEVQGYVVDSDGNKGVISFGARC